jgi:hypothetical protein
MVSPFEVYLVMQLDSINALFGLLAGASALLAGGWLFIVAMSTDFDFQASKEEKKVRLDAAKKFSFRTFLFGVACLVAAAFLPSTKTAAAMILIPALTSKEVVEPVATEAKELYGLAKEALRGLAERKPEPKSED